MLCYDRIHVSEGIDINKISTPKECIICHHWYFLDKGFRFQPTVSKDCHDVVMVSIDISSIAILNIRGVDYCCIIFETIHCNKFIFVAYSIKN